MSHNFRISGKRLFNFAVIADTHITEEEATAIGGYDLDTVALSTQRSAYVIDKLNNLKPDFVIHLGDITHPEPGTPAYEKSAARFHSVYSKLISPLHLVPGNHDVGEKAFAGQSLPGQQAQMMVNNEMIAEYESHFQPHYYSFEHRQCLLVIINGLIINSGLAAEESQRDWLETLLDQNQGRRIFLFSHYPTYLSHPDESEHYDATDEPGRSWLLNTLAHYKVEAFYSGHVHNFFFNIHGHTRCYVLPSTCFLRHDYHELFRAEPGMKQGRHDSAKLGFALVEVYDQAHLTHIIRTYGNARNQSQPAENPDSLQRIQESPVHALGLTSPRVGIHLRLPWCENADIPTPWGLDPFHRKNVRNDYPLLALWEMGVRDLRVPLDDLINPETRSRMLTLTSIGHRFTVYSHGIPKDLALRSLVEHQHLISAWEIVFPITSIIELFEEIEEIKGSIPVYFNAMRWTDETFSNSHGLAADDVGTIQSLLKLDSVNALINGVVFGINYAACPFSTVSSIYDNLSNQTLKLAFHPQFVQRAPEKQKQSQQQVINRLAETVITALCFADAIFFLDNFTPIDRGYYFGSGLVDRLYNPLVGAHIVKNIQSAIQTSCNIGRITDNTWGRVLQLANPPGALLLPTVQCKPSVLTANDPLPDCTWINLITGMSEAQPAKIDCPTLALVN